MIKEIKELNAWTYGSPDSPSREYVRECYPLSREDYSELRNNIDRFASKTPMINWRCSEPHVEWNLMIGPYEVTMTTGSHCESIVIRPMVMERYHITIMDAWGEFCHAYYNDEKDETKNDFQKTKEVLEGLREEFRKIKDIPVA